MLGALALQVLNTALIPANEITYLLVEAASSFLGHTDPR